jgi:hypothetical protein
MKRTKSHHVVMRFITPLTVWAVSKLLETEPVKKALEKADSHAYVAKRRTWRRVKTAGHNAMHNSAWLAAGTAAIVIGAEMIGKATRRS